MNKSEKWGVSIYKGEERIALIPDQLHKSGLTIGAEYCIILTGVFDAQKIGNAVLTAIEYSKNSPISQKTREEMNNTATWKKTTKYKTWNSFWKNNLAADVDYRNSGEYHIASYKRSTKNGDYKGLAKHIILPYSATAEEIGQAVLEAFRVAKEYHANLEKENKARYSEKNS